MTVAQLKTSASSENSPPAGLSDEARALWFVHADRWEEAHTIAQDIDTPVGSWIHALLHLIEGDENNARYWFTRAARPSVNMSEIEALWTQIAGFVLND